MTKKTDFLLLSSLWTILSLCENYSRNAFPVKRQTYLTLY